MINLVILIRLRLVGAPLRLRLGLLRRSPTKQFNRSSLELFFSEKNKSQSYFEGAINYDSSKTAPPGGALSNTLLSHIINSFFYISMIGTA